MATRFYLPSTGDAAVSPAFGGWTYTAEASRRAMVRTKISSAMTSVAITDQQETASTYLWRQYVSAAIPAQTITGTVKGQVRVTEQTVDDNHDRVTILLKVVSNDGATLRGTLLSLNWYGTTNEYPVTPATNRFMADGDTVSSVVAQSGDRIVLEIGTQPSTLPGTFESLISAFFGDDSATDLPENEGDTGSKNPWFEFSQDLFDQTSTPDSVQITATVPAQTSAVVAVPPSVGMLLSSSGGATNVLAKPASVGMAASVPGQQIEFVTDSYNPEAVTTQNFVVIRATSPANLGDADATTYVSDNEIPGLPEGGTVEVTATTMADPIIPFGGTITHVVFGAICWRFDWDATPGNNTNYRMGWKVGEDAAEAAITNDAGLPEIIVVDEDGIDENTTALHPHYIVRTGPITTQPNTQPWTEQAVKDLVDVAVRYDYLAGSWAEIQVAEIFAEVHGPIGSDVPPIGVRAFLGRVIKTLRIVKTIEQS